MINNFSVSIALTIFLFLSASFSYSRAQEPKHFGLNIPPQSFKEEINKAQELGIDTIRVPLQWQMIEPRPGEFNWGITDGIVRTAQEKNIEILFTIRSISSWGTEKQTQASGIFHSSSAPINIKQWERFIEAIASRYRGLGVNYEIENEVNGPAFWRGSLEEYSDLLKASYYAVKKADPQSKVLTSAMGCGIVRNLRGNKARNEAIKRHDEWLRAILSTKAFDIVSIHDYYFPSEIRANGLTFLSYLEHIKHIMKEAHVDDWPIWLTETGYVSRPEDASGRMDNGSPHRQAKWLSEAYHQAFEFGVERIFWLLIRDRDELYFGSMGLTDKQGRPRPALDILKKLSKPKRDKI